MPETTERFDAWALVEIMGHKQLAGRVRETTLAGAGMLRVDVPEVDDEGVTLPAFTKLLSPLALYAVTPIEEAVARRLAASLRERPVEAWRLPEVPALPAPVAVPRHGCPVDPECRSWLESVEDGTGGCLLPACDVGALDPSVERGIRCDLRDCKDEHCPCPWAVQEVHRLRAARVPDPPESPEAAPPPALDLIACDDCLSGDHCERKRLATEPIRACADQQPIPF